ncbi:MAG: Lrp/AsnC family transcriptional regulator [Candidatus Bathyarchaeota archaeon]|nr:Lrp/AsnC family transcriptional regulator [Candidatus Bathyarchaeota archaeon A05DMB-3]MDH7606250.1 Lrp/AsnC family transcriptional regulator [Candidatus Bathyarchaeota archaeon]
MEALTKRSIQLLKLLYEKGKMTSTYSTHIRQNDLAKELGISRQALNLHLKRLRNLNYIRTGRGFIDVTEKGLNALGFSSTPAFIFIKVSPSKRSEVYRKIREIALQRAFRVAGDVDAILVVDRDKLNEILRRLSEIEGVKDTRSYVAIESLK